MIIDQQFKVVLPVLEQGSIENVPVEICVRVQSCSDAAAKTIDAVVDLAIRKTFGMDDTTTEAKL